MRTVKVSTLGWIAAACFAWSGVALGQTLGEFFNGDQLVRIDLEMAPADWGALHEHYLDNTYYRCTFRWQDKKLEGVGIRSRGNQSRSPIKPSLGLDFGKYASGQRFLGLKSLVLRNLNQDGSLMRERLSESIFARMNLPHSAEAHARLYVNGEYAGVYLLVEPIDKTFLDARLGDSSGYLYEFNHPGTPFYFDRLSEEGEANILAMFEPKTHEDNPDVAGLLEFIHFVNDASDEEFAEGIGRYLDTENFLTHAAVEQAVAQWDGLLGINGMNNFYLYRRGETRQGMFLVWDQDGAFSDYWWSMWERTGENVLMRRLLAIPEQRLIFVHAVERAAHAMGDEDWLAREVDRIYEQVRDAAYEDPFRLCRAETGIELCSGARFEEEVAYLREFARFRPGLLLEEVQQELGAQPPTDESGE